jgi:hypothetical protein
VIAHQHATLTEHVGCQRRDAELAMQQVALSAQPAARVFRCPSLGCYLDITVSGQHSQAKLLRTVVVGCMVSSSHSGRCLFNFTIQVPIATHGRSADQLRRVARTPTLNFKTACLVHIGLYLFNCYVIETALMLFL